MAHPAFSHRVPSPFDGQVDSKKVIEFGCCSTTVIQLESHQIPPRSHKRGGGLLCRAWTCWASRPGTQDEYRNTLSRSRFSFVFLRNTPYMGV